MGEFIWKPVEYVTEPQSNLVEVLRDRWWVTNDKGEISLFRCHPKDRHLSPQCNSDKSIVERLGTVNGSGGTDMVFIPLAFLSVEPSVFV